MGTFTTTGNFRTKSGKVSLDPRVENIMRQAAAVSPYNVVAFSGVAGRNTGTKNHPGGYAVDIFLQDPKTGQLLTNYSKPEYQHQGTWQQNFPIYEKFAQLTRVVQQQSYPELDSRWRAGIYFNPGRGNVSPDMMHFDITPNYARTAALGGTMGGGEWATGANPDFLARYGLKSNGGLSQMRGVIEADIAGHPVPPVDIPNVVPLPRPNSIPSAMPVSVRDAYLTGDAGLGYTANPSRVFSTGDELAFDPVTTADFGVTSPTEYPHFDAAYDPAAGAARMIDDARTQVAAQQQQAATTMVPGDWGVVSPGNIDLFHRPVVMLPDGNRATVLSANFTNDDGTSVLVPRVAPDGAILSNQQALDRYHQTGENLGVFKNDAAAETYANALHDQQAVLYATTPPTHYLLPGTQGQSPDERQAAKPAPAATVLAKGYNQLTDEQRTAIAAVPASPSTPPADLISNTFAALGASNARPDVVNDDFEAIAKMKRGNMTVATPPGYNQVSDAQRTAMAALPVGTGAWALEAISTMQAIAALPPPLPATDPRSVPVTPLPPIARAAPQPAVAPPSTADATPPAKTVKVNGRSYVVGEDYHLGNGATFRVNDDGSFSKVSATPRAATVIQLGLDAANPNSDLNRTLNAVKSAPAVVAQAGNLAKGVGATVGGLFGGLGSMFGGATKSDTVTGQAMVATPGAVQRVAPIPTWQDYMAPAPKAPASPATTIGTSPDWAALMKGAPAPAASSGKSGSTNWFKPYTDAFPNVGASTPTNAASAELAKTATMHDLNADALAGIPQYIKITKQKQVPDNQPIEQGSGVHFDANLGQYVINDTPPVTSFKTVSTVQSIKNPAYVAQQRKMAMWASGYTDAATMASVPETVQRYNAGTGRVDTVTLFRPTSSTPQTRVQQLQAAGLSPSEAYDAAAARAFANGTPNGNINNPGNANGQKVASGQNTAQSMGGMPG